MFPRKIKNIGCCDSGFKSYQDFSNFVKEIDQTVVTVIKEDRGRRLAVILRPIKSSVHRKPIR